MALQGVALVLVSLLPGQAVDHKLGVLSEKARVAQESGDAAQAAAAYEEILRLRPGWAPAEFNLGLMYQQQKRHEEAIRAFTSALRHDPNLAPARLFAGISYFNIGRHDSAVSSLEHFLRLQPADREVRFFLAGAYYAREEYGKAAQQYLEQARLTPDRGELYYHLGECYLALARSSVKMFAEHPAGKYFLLLLSAEGQAQMAGSEAPMELIRQAIQLDPSRPEAYVSLGRYLVQHGNPLDAEKRLREALNQQPSECLVLAALAEASLAAGNMDAFLEISRRIILVRHGCVEEPLVETEAPPPAGFADVLKRLRNLPCPAGVDGWSHLIRAGCLESRDQMQPATTALLRARVAAADDPRIAYWSFRLYLRLSQRALTRLEQLAPGSYLLAHIRAQTLEEQGKFDDAEVEYQNSVRLAGGDPVPFIEYARFKARNNELDNGISLLQKALAIDPHNAKGNALLGELYVLNSGWGAALPHLENAVNNGPHDGQSRIYLARCLERLGRMAEAISILEKAPRDDDGRIHYVLAGYYRGQGRRREAARALEIFRQRSKVRPASRESAPGPL